MPPFRAAYLIALLALAAGPALAATPPAGKGRGAKLATRARAGMVAIPAGSYRPLYGRPSDPLTSVAAFRLDRDPVTREEFLAFVRADPQWRRSTIRPLFADRRGYLADWPADLDAGAAAAASND